MLQRLVVIGTLLLTVPTFAQAWTISARIAAGSGSVSYAGTPLVPPPGYVALASTVPYADLTVTPAEGSTISSVLVDGKTAAAVSPGVYRVSYNGTNSHSIAAYFKANKVTVTSTQVPQGTFTIQQTAPTLGVPTTGNLEVLPGAKIKVVATPMGGYRVGKVTIGTTDYPGGTVSDVVITGATTVTATYDLLPVVSITGLAISPDILLNDKGMTLTATAAGNAAAGAIAYSVAVKDAVGNPARLYADGNGAGYSIALTPSISGNVATFGYYQSMHYSYYMAPGNYTAVVTATSTSGASDTRFISFTVLDAEVYATNSCTGCHSNSTPGIVADWQAGKHAAPRTQESATICFRCHTAEGHLYAEKTPYTGDVSFLINAPAATLPGTSSPIGCAICHSGAPHNGALRPVMGWTSAETGAASEQFNVCTGCHTLSVKGQDGNQQVAEHYHVAGFVKLGRFIADTHFDDPATPAGQGTESGSVINKIEGYVVRVNGASPCSDCHDVHQAQIQPPGLIPDTNAPPSLHQQWARSRHAGQILKIKEDFVRATFSSPTGAPGSNTTGELDKSTERTEANALLVSRQAATDATAAAWTHYTWNDSTRLIDPVSTTDRQDCQHCHTATGAANYLSNRAAYSPANNDFSHLAGWSANRRSPQAEVLYCWGCHSDAGKGTLRTIEPMMLDYKAAAGDAANIVLPTEGSSSACVSCHAGRGNVVSLMGAGFVAATPALPLDGTTVPKNSATATATHYLNAAATLFKDETRVGYEFPGVSYADPEYFEHKAVGCADCHMSSATPHAFDALTRNASGVVTKLTATNCITCHSGTYGTRLLAGDSAAAAFLDKEARGFADALALFNEALIAQGYTWTSSYPYFSFSGPLAAEKWRTQGDLGAGHNFNYLKHEPGAYAHNSQYAKRLIFDSIDWLDDGVLSGTISIDATRYPGAAEWFGSPASPSGTYAATRP